jgi:hypothetical protein
MTRHCVSSHDAPHTTRATRPFVRYAEAGPLEAAGSRPARPGGRSLQPSQRAAPQAPRHGATRSSAMRTRPPDGVRVARPARPPTARPARPRIRASATEAPQPAPTSAESPHSEAAPPATADIAPRPTRPPGPDQPQQPRRPCWRCLSSSLLPNLSTRRIRIRVVKRRLPGASAKIVDGFASNPPPFKTLIRPARCQSS